MKFTNGVYLSSNPFRLLLTVAVIVGILLVFFLVSGVIVAVSESAEDYNIGRMPYDNKGEQPIYLPKEINPEWLKRSDYRVMQFSINVWMFYWSLPEIKDYYFTLVTAIDRDCPHGCLLGIYGVISGKFRHWVYDEEDKPVVATEKLFQEHIYGYDNVPLRRLE